MKVTKILFAAIGIASLVAWHCQRHTTEPLPTTISGKALLTGPIEHKRHDGILIVNLQTRDSTSTDKYGNFNLPLPANDGTYRLAAYYVYFDSASTEVTIQKRKVISGIPTLQLHQQLVVSISTDKSLYRFQDGITITTRFSNISTQEIYAPVQARALRPIFINLEDSSMAVLPQIPNYRWWCRGPYPPKEDSTLIFRTDVSAWQYWGLKSGLYHLYVFSNCWHVSQIIDKPDIDIYARLIQPVKIQILP
jgi:hypothetical protein